MVGMFERPDLYGLVILLFDSWLWPLCHFDIARSSWLTLAVFNSHYTLLKMFILFSSITCELSARCVRLFCTVWERIVDLCINSSYALMFFVLPMLVLKNLSDLRRERWVRRDGNGSPPAVVCLDEIKKRLKIFTCSLETFDFNSLFWIESFTFLSQASLLVWNVHLYTLFAKGNPSMRVLTLRWVFVRRFSHPWDCLSECVPKVVFEQRVVDERKKLILVQRTEAWITHRELGFYLTCRAMTPQLGERTEEWMYPSDRFTMWITSWTKFPEIFKVHITTLFFQIRIASSSSNKPSQKHKAEFKSKREQQIQSRYNNQWTNRSREEGESVAKQIGTSITDFVSTEPEWNQKVRRWVCVLFLLFARSRKIEVFFWKSDLRIEERKKMDC